MKMYQRVYHCLLCLLFLMPGLQVAAHETFGAFRDWDVMPHQVVGILKITQTQGREYWNITSVDGNTVKVERVNAAGVVTELNFVTFENGILSRVARGNRWGDMNLIINYTSLGNDEFMVTSKTAGKNDFLPAKQAKYTYVNDLLAEIKYISFDGSICNGPEGVAIEKIKRYDDEDRFTEEKEHAYFDETGEPVMNKAQDYHKVIYECDKRGNTISAAYFNEKGQPTPTRLGSYRYVKEYDANDKETDYRNVTAEGQLRNELNGCARAKSENKNGFRVKLTFYNAANKIAREKDAGYGVAIIKYQYDGAGNEVKQSYYDENDRPMNDPSGIHRVNYKYSDQNMRLATEYFDKDGLPVNNRDNIHMYTYDRDDLGRTIATAFFDKYYEPVKNEFDQVYMIKYTYDSAGLKTSESYWKDKNTKMRRWDGFHLNKFKYNDQGQKTEVGTYDENGLPLASSVGKSRVVLLYDPYCRVSEKLAYDGDKPVLIRKGTINLYHSVRYAYDKRNRVSAIEYFDTHGNPTNAAFTIDGGFYGHKVEIIYIGDQVTQQKVYAVAGNAPVKVIDCISQEYVSTGGIATESPIRASGN